MRSTCLNRYVVYTSGMHPAMGCSKYNGQQMEECKYTVFIQRKYVGKHSYFPVDHATTAVSERGKSV